MKKDAYYFSHDSNSKDDPKCMLLIDQLGLEGYGIFWVLIETLRDQPGYKYPIELVPILARKYNTSAEKMMLVVEKYNFFQIDNDKNFFSISLNERMEKLENNREQRRLAGKKSGEARRKKAQEKERPFNDRSTTDEQSSNENEQSKVEESRVEESKGKENKGKDIKDMSEKELFDFVKEKGYQIAIIPENAESLFLNNGTPNNSKSNIESIYSMYPTICEKGNRNTGKTPKNKVKIKSLLKSQYTYESLKSIIERYIRESGSSRGYIQNFGTFLNNIPDYGNSEEITEREDLSKFTHYTYCFPEQATQTITIAQFNEIKDRIMRNNFKPGFEPKLITMNV